MAGEQTTTDYISHHLTRWTYGYLPGEGCKLPILLKKLVQWALKPSTLILMLWSIGLGIVFCAIFWMVARKVTSGVPGKTQAAVEMIVEFVDNNVRDSAELYLKADCAFGVNYLCMDILNELDGFTTRRLYSYDCWPNRRNDGT